MIGIRSSHFIFIAFHTLPKMETTVKTELWKFQQEYLDQRLELAETAIWTMAVYKFRQR
jgi:hypothetical protein